MSEARPRRRLEAELSPVQLKALAEDCLLLGIPRDEWQQVASLRVKYESTAVAACALRIVRDEHRAWTDALLRASIFLGINYEAARKRLNSWCRCPRVLPTAEENLSGRIYPGEEVVAGARRAR